MSQITTIRLHKATKDHLDRLKVHPREPYEDVINRVLVKIAQSQQHEDPRSMAVDEFAQKMRGAYGDQIQKMIVYGSYARGEESDGSDVDILIIWKGKLASGRKALADVATQILIERGILISPKLVSPKIYERMTKLGTPFAKNVEREGIPIA